MFIQRQFASGVNESNNRQNNADPLPTRRICMRIFASTTTPTNTQCYEERLDAQNPYEIDVQKIPNMTAEYTASPLRCILPSGNEILTLCFLKTI